MDIRTEVPQSDLLAFTSLYRQRIGINPLVCGDVGGFVSIGKNVEDGRLINDGEESHC